MTQCNSCGKNFKRIKLHQCKVRKLQAAPPPEQYEPKPTLVKCGETYINPKDVSSVRRVKMGLYIVRLTSEPNQVYPIWLREEEVSNLIQYFRIVGDL